MKRMTPIYTKIAPSKECVARERRMKNLLLQVTILYSKEITSCGAKGMAKIDNNKREFFVAYNRKVKHNGYTYEIDVPPTLG